MAFNWKPPPNAGQAGAVPKTNTIQCKSCGGTDFDDFCESGDRACALCGTVLQENGIVSTIQFSESGGSSNVVGQFVSGDKGRPSGGGAGGRGRGRFGHSRDSRETTIQNGKKKILQVLAQLHLKTTLAEPAGRLFSLCVNQNYVQGRKTMNIVAACVYIVCRQKHFPIMLIDISDKLAVNVYVLGKTFQKLIKYLNLQTAVPIVDPAMYIKRFAAKLELGSKTNAVCMTALKIIGSMKRDFLASGRQPAGVCCAALTLATRVNRIERSKEEIRKAVKVCDATVRKRLLEFEATPTSQLTVEELNKLPQDGSFPGVDEQARGAEGGAPAEGDAGDAGGASDVSVLVSDVRMDPPAFIANRIRDGRLKMPWTQQTFPHTATRKEGRGKGAHRKRAGKTDPEEEGREGEEEEDEREGGAASGDAASSGGAGAKSARRSGKDKTAAAVRSKASPKRGKVAAAAAAAAAEKRKITKRDKKKGCLDQEEEEEEGVAGVTGRRSRGTPKRKLAAAGKGCTDGVEGGEGEEKDEGDESELSPEEGSGDDGDDDDNVTDDDEEGGEEENEKGDSHHGAAIAKGKGKGKRKASSAAATGSKRRRVPARYEEFSDEEDSDEEDSDEGDSEEEDSDEDESDEEDEENDYLASKMKVDANTDEGREALTRHVLSVRASYNGSRVAKSRARRNKESSKLYASLESMLDEDAARGQDPRSSSSTMPVEPQGGNAKEQPVDDGRGARDGSDAAGEESAGVGDKDRGASRQQKADPSTLTEKPSAGGADGGDEVEWGLFLRTPEDEQRTKREWEKEHKAWIEDQEEKIRLLEEEGASLSATKKKRKYNSSSSKAGAGTFADVLQTEAAKNKSLKIDHAALQRVMNQDGSLKNVDEDDDGPMEEVTEGSVALPPLPFSKHAKGARGGQVKAPLTTTPSPSSSSPSLVGVKPFTGGPVLPPAPRNRAGAAGRGAAAGSSEAGGAEGRGAREAVDGARGGRGQQQQQPQPQLQLRPQSVAAPTVKMTTVKEPWARAGPDDGGEMAIKSVLNMLQKGGLGALPPISAVAASVDVDASAPTSAAPAPAPTPALAASPPLPAPATVPSVEPAVKKPAVADTREEIEGPIEDGAEEDAVEGVTEKEKGMGVAEDEEEEDDEDDDEYFEGGVMGMYGGEDDDDDPYGEEA